MGLLIPQTGETVWLESEETVLERKNKEVWELGDPLEVVWQQGRLCAKMIVENNPDVEQIIFPITSMFGVAPTIAIKGISDKKERLFFFKVNPPESQLP